MSARRRPPSPLCRAAAASRGCPQHPWVAGRPWARSASHTAQCCPALVPILGSLQRIEMAPRGRSVILYLPWPRSCLSETRPCPAASLRTRPSLLLGSWRPSLDLKPRWQGLLALKFDIYLILWLYCLILWLCGLILCWILFDDSLCLSNTSYIWYLVSHGEPTCYGWRKIETDSSCDRWSGGTSLDPMCKRETLKRDFSWFRTVMWKWDHTGWVGTWHQKRVACPHEVVDGTVRAIVVRFELKAGQIVTLVI
jgi:hypothetical protein